MKFHTKFRPGDLVRDKITNDEGVIIEAEAIWKDKHNDLTHMGCSERKQPGSVYQGGTYGVYPKGEVGSLNGYWYSEDSIELVEKGFLY